MRKVSRTLGQEVLGRGVLAMIGVGTPGEKYVISFRIRVSTT